MKVWLVCLALLIGGCTSMYVPMEGDDPHGYSDEKLSERQYRVVYRTYRQAELDELRRYVTFRAAEIARVNGFSHFLMEEFTTATTEGDFRVGDRVITSGGHSSGSSSGTSPSVMIMVPGYSRDMDIKSVQAMISLHSQAVDGAEATAKILAQGSPD